MSEVIRVRLTAAGRVQGVFFRASTRDEAQRLGLSGWARNLPDGGVEVAFQGPRDRVQQAVAFVRAGPGHARVDEVDVHEVPVEPDDRVFVIG